MKLFILLAVCVALCVARPCVDSCSCDQNNSDSGQDQNGGHDQIGGQGQNGGQGQTGGQNDGYSVAQAVAPATLGILDGHGLAHLSLAPAVNLLSTRSLAAAANPNSAAAASY